MENNNINNEIWKDIEGYEGLYQVSNLGRVNSLARVVKYKNYNSKNNSNCHKVVEKIKKATCKGKGSHGGGGYYVVTLYKNGKSKQWYVHRLVAMAFLPNDENKETVNHIDGDKSNNCLSNLEWATYSENVHHAIETGLNNMEDRDYSSMSIRVVQYDLDWVKIAEFPSMREAQRKTGCDCTQIGKCCRNPQKTCGGFHWGFLNKQGA